VVAYFKPGKPHPTVRAQTKMEGDHTLFNEDFIDTGFKRRNSGAIKTQRAASTLG
jgi:hypothetical protein